MAAPGWGLAICRVLIGLTGGRMGVESRVGSGSTFWFDEEVSRYRQTLVAPEGEDGNRDERD